MVCAGPPVAQPCTMRGHMLPQATVRALSEDAGMGRSALRYGLGGPRDQRPAPSRRRRGGTASAIGQPLARFLSSTYKGPARLRPPPPPHPRSRIPTPTQPEGPARLRPPLAPLPTFPASRTSPSRRHRPLPMPIPAPSSIETSSRTTSSSLQGIRSRSPTSASPASCVPMPPSRPCRAPA
jgi:hypothetical protein